MSQGQGPDYRGGAGGAWQVMNTGAGGGGGSGGVGPTGPTGATGPTRATTEAERAAMMLGAANQSPSNETLAQCPVCDFEIYEDFLPLHIKVNHPVPRKRWWVSALRWLVTTQTIACGGAPFSLAETFDAQPVTIEDQPDAPTQTDVATEQPSPLGIANIRELPDAQGIGRDSGSGGDVVLDSAINALDSAINALDSGNGDTVPQGPQADSPTAIADAGHEVESGGIQADSGACPPPPVAGGYSNICATAPSRGSSIIQTFPGECACNWTCACLMTSSVCQGLGTPQSCQVVNGAVCNSVVVAVVICH